MNKIQSYIVNKDLPSAGFGDGKLLDESAPLAADGSAITVQTHNDYLYAHHAPIQKYNPAGEPSDTDESDTASDARDAAEYMVGIKNELVSEWDSVTGYAVDGHVIHRGIQFVSMVAGNLNNDPFTNPDKWLPCFARDDAFVKWQKGDDIQGGFDILHNYRDAGYRQLFSWGKYNTGGATPVGGGGVGVNYEAFGVHLDGTVITGDPTLEAIFNVGLADEYHLLDVIAPDVVGTRTLLDTRGAAAAIVDAIAGSRADVGVYQDDAAQEVTGNFKTALQASGVATLFVAVNGAFTIGNPAVVSYPTTIAATNAINNQITFDNATSILPNPAKTDPLETRMKNYSVGVASILVINEV